MVLLPADVHQDISVVICSLGMLKSKQLSSYFHTSSSIYFKVVLVHLLFLKTISKWTSKKQIKKTRSWC